MKTTNMFIVLVISIMCFSGTSQAINQIYSIDRYFGIVADNTDWICGVSNTQVPGLRIPLGYKYVKGQSKLYPLLFTFWDAGC